MGLQRHYEDRYEPEQIISLTDDTVGLNAVLVIDDTRLGPSLGGIRFALNGSVEECKRLAHAMTLKNAAADLAYGGGKSIVFANPELSFEQKSQLLQALGKQLAPITDYIPGPDMGVNEKLMSVVKTTCGRAIGLPAEEGGIPLDEIGATAHGLMAAIKVALKQINKPINQVRFVVQGFGSVGSHLARFLTNEGATMVGVGDISGARIDQEGIHANRLWEHVRHGGFVGDSFEGHPAGGDELIDVDCDIWIPAARPDVFNAQNAGRVKAKIIAQGANIPATDNAEEIFHKRGIIVLPDFISNAGGVICGVVEYEGGTKAQALERIENTIRKNTEQVLISAQKRGIRPRYAALELAYAKLENLK